MLPRRADKYLTASLWLMSAKESPLTAIKLEVYQTMNNLRGLHDLWSGLQYKRFFSV
jgi:hypothetical protein